MASNTKATILEGFETETGNYFVHIKEGNQDFYFFMCPKGKHLDGYERKSRKPHSQNKWHEVVNKVGKDAVKPLQGEPLRLAQHLLKFTIKPMVKQFAAEKVREERTAERDDKFQPATCKAFAGLKAMLQAKAT